MQKKTVIFVGGGTMGSVSPLLSVWQELRKDSSIQGIWIGTIKGIEEEPVKKEGLIFHSIFSGKLRRYISFKNITDIGFIIIGFFQSLYYLKKYKPHIILTSGSFVCVPVAYAAWVLRIPIHLHQQDLLIGLANRLIKPIAKVVTVAVPELKRSFAKVQAIHTGNPIRNELLRPITRQEGLAFFSLSKEKKTLFITGGGTGAVAINKKIQEILPILLEQYNVIHLTGPGKNEITFKHPNYKVFEFIPATQMAYAYAASDIVISRAGMSSIMEIAALQKPSIIIPIPDSHQEKNAQYLRDLQAAIVMDQHVTSDTFLHEIQKLMSDETLKKTMKKNIGFINSKEAHLHLSQVIQIYMGSQLDLSSIKKVFICGIGGIGTSAVAKYFYRNGIQVMGSDIQKTEITQELEALRIPVFYTQQASNIPEDIDLYIFTPAIPEQHPEKEKAKTLNIPMYSYPAFLALLSKSKETIAISGTHGKSTTTALTGLLLEAGKIDPTIFIGSRVTAFEDKNVRIGASQKLVVEACEYKAAMCDIHAKIIVLTNIEWDHPDYYKTPESVLEAFKKFVENLPSDGLLVFNQDDRATKEVAQQYSGHTISFGKEGADVQFKNVQVKEGKQVFTLLYQGRELGEIQLQIPGEFNIYNALGAISVALYYGISFETIKETLESFKGIWRRFEILGKSPQRALIISDYGHHPTAVAKTLKGAKEFYPDKRIVLVYQPHQHARTAQLFTEFVQAFDEADLVLLADIYDVAGREVQDEEMTSEKLASEVAKRGGHTIASGSITHTLEMLKKNITANDVVIVMGAGDIFQVAQECISK